ncbi:MAG TPA: tetratricopeptide repeat protein [Bryobacteraceae bacterium]|nr:tetratricopeptide repeat protein [Bryobacteraceae bacterium]
MPPRLRAVLCGLLAAAVLLPAQTLQEAEALRKARRYEESNEIFRVLVDKFPKNAEYRVRWGRLFLEHWQPDEAAGLFNEALGIDKNYAPAYLGLALIAEENFEGHAEDLAKKALELDPKLVEAQELMARLALEDNNNEKAVAEARKALALDANSVQAKAILATMDWLADKQETQWDPHDARGYETAGHFFTLNRRYAEAIEYYRKALMLDPQLNTARSQMAINLMRLGQDQEAYQQLKLCWDNGFQDKATKNSLTLLDSSKNFVTFKTPTTILKLNKKEADLLHPYFEEEMKRVIATYEKKYQFKLSGPVQVEVYPDHEDFAVRTLGMPGIGAVGVTFTGKLGGVDYYSIAMDSPSSDQRPPGSFHWASTLWHEMSHVYTLSMTNSRVPRWFTEGIAVHEETAINKEWGDRLSPDIIQWIKEGKLLPIAQIDRGFVHPVLPVQVLVSYFEAGRICDYITDKWGWDTILAMLHDFANNEETTEVVRKELKIEPQEFDKRFIAWVDADTKNTVDHFDEWKKGVTDLVTLSNKKDYDGIIKEGTRLRDMYPDYVEKHSVYEILAQAYLAKNDKPDAIAEMERYAKIGGRSPDTLMSLAKLLEEAGNKKEAAAILERLNYIYPMENEEHRELGTLLFELGQPAGAVREFRAVVDHKPIDPAQAHYDLARALRLNHQDEQAKDEVVASLEAAPGFEKAQKLLLELTAADSPGTPPIPVKK